MNLRFQKLFQVHVEHMYFADLLFSAFKIVPTEESLSLLSKYGLIYKSLKDGFIICFEKRFEAHNLIRESLLKELITLKFSLEITDPAFHTYTGNLPDDPVRKMFRFSNFDEEQHVPVTSELLHKTEFVAQSDIASSPALLNYFGDIEIQFHPHLKADLYIRFLNRSEPWRYIIVSEDPHKLENSAILDKANEQVFSGPEPVELPDGKKGIAFTSVGPIALTQYKKTGFRLVSNFDRITKHYQSALTDNLPYPSVLTEDKSLECIIFL